MLPCARSCIGRKLNHLPAGCAEPVPSEPLLFLYPRWFQKAARRTARIETNRGRTFSSTIRSCSRAVAGTTYQSNDTFSNLNTTGLHKDEAAQSVKFPAGSTRRVASNPSSSPPSGSSIAESWQPLLEDAERTSDKKVIPRHNHAHQNLRRGTNSHRRYDPPKFDTLDLARKLASQQTVVPDDLETVSVGATFLEWLTGTSEENVWRHRDGTGCIVHANLNTEEYGSERTITLIGTARAREIAGLHLKNLEKEHNKLYEHERAGGRDEDKTTPNHFVRVDQLPKPESWSIKSFASFVTQIVGCQAPRGVERILYPKEESFNKAAASALMALFADSNLQQFQSSFALRQALEFCSTRTDIAFAARNVWTSARDAEIVPDVTCFNLEISKCFRVRNGTGISCLIDEMSTTHIQPDGATWALFFKQLKTQEERNRFLEIPSIQNRAYDRFSKEVMVQAVIETTFKPSDRDTANVTFFQEKMHAAFGDGWLTPSIMQQLIQRCAEVHAPRTTSKLLRLASSLDVELDDKSFLSLLKAVAKTGWFEDILLLLKFQPPHHNSLLNQKQVELAFREAWRQRLTNTCRVLWHYAASHGSICHSMVAKVSSQLTRNVHSSVGSQHRVPSWMAALTIGVDISARPASSTTSHPEHIQHTIASLSRWTSKGEARHNQMQAAHLLLERDLTAWRRVEAMDHATFLNLMHEAFLLDTSWRDRDVMAHQQLPDLLQQAIQIELRPVNLQTNDLAQEAPDSNTNVTITMSSFSKHSSEAPTLDTKERRAETPAREQSLGLDSDSGNSSHILNFQNLQLANVPMAPTTPVLTATHLPLVDIVLRFLGLPWRDS